MPSSSEYGKLKTLPSKVFSARRFITHQKSCARLLIQNKSSKSRHLRLNGLDGAQKRKTLISLSAPNLNNERQNGKKQNAL